MAREVPESQEASSSRHTNGNGNSNRNGLGRTGSGRNDNSIDLVDSFDSSQEASDSGSGLPSNSNGKRKRAGYTLKDVFRKQDVAEKQRVTMVLNERREQAEDDRTNLANISFRDIMDRVRDQNEQFLDVRDIGNSAIDADILLGYTDMTNKKARQFRSDTSAFDCDGFLIKIKSILGLERTINGDEDDDESEIDELEDEEEREARQARRARGARGGEGGVLGDWDRIGWMASKRSRRAPGVEFMLGPLATQYTKRIVAPRQKRAALAPVQRPEEIVQDKEKKVDDTLTFVKKVGKQLSKLDPQSKGIPYFPFFIHPTSFGQSVENNFFVSFLIRDGRAGLHLSEHNELIITYRDLYAEEDEEVEEGGVRDGEVAKGASQGVLELDMETWQEAVSLYNITKSTIPHREPPAGPKRMGANQWY